MLFTREARVEREIALKVLTIANQNLRVAGRLQQTRHPIMIDPVPGANALDMNWKLVIGMPCDGDIAAALQEAAEVVQTDWRLALRS